MDPTPHASPSAGFPEVDDAAWRAAAEEALEGASFERLVTRLPGGIEVQPIYSRTSVPPPPWRARLPGFPPYVRGATPLGARAGWLICQETAGATAEERNRTLLDDLSRGQNAVLFRPTDAARRGEPAAMAAAEQELRVRLEGVDPVAAPVIAPAGLAAPRLAVALAEVAAARGRARRDLPGAVVLDPLGEALRAGGLPGGVDAAFARLAELAAWARDRGAGLRVVGVEAALWGDAGADAVQELGFGLATGIETLRRLAAAGVPVDEAAPRVLYTASLGPDLFLEVAKCRAARLLWARAVEAADGGADAQRLVAHGRVTPWDQSVLDPHNNLLRATVAAFAGVVGGCAGLEIPSFDALAGAPSEPGRRWARNLHLILHEECQAGQVVDPAGGSYYVETLTRQLAEAAWSLFQEVERRGGMAAALAAGWPQEAAERSAAARIAAVATRRDGLVGVNLHPDLRGTVPAPARDDRTSGSAAVRPLRPRRRAEPFEALRRRSDAALARDGVRPRAFLVRLGPRRQHAARAEFSAGFFAAGGFAVVAGEPVETPEAAAAAADGAPVVVLCSTDESHPALVPPLAAALKARRPAPVVVLAGLPAAPELRERFRGAGVDEFIHLRADAAQLLAALQDRLGLPPA